MSQIRVRRSGLVSFAIRIGSTLTGLVFVVLVTSNLSQSDFGLWQLISRVVGYVIFGGNILSFWTIRYRARGMLLGKTVVVGAAIFSLVLSMIYILSSFGVVSSISPGGEYFSNFYYFLISTPQVSLYVFTAVLEAILWASSPEKASIGFAVFEIAKVIIGGVTVAVFHLSLTGAILAIIGAQTVQLITIFGMTRSEYQDTLSLSIVSRMVKTSWVAILNHVSPLVLSFDFLIVALMTGSTIPIALYGVSIVYGTIITYSNWIAYGLYAGILSGIDPRKSSNRVLELQYLFIVPMVLGELIIPYRLLHLFGPGYTVAVPILMILAIASPLNALSSTFDNIIIGTDRTDASDATSFSIYAKSKLFWVAKINIGVSSAYLIAVAIISKVFSLEGSTTFGYSNYVFIGILWAVSALGMWGFALVLKTRLVTKITELKIPKRDGLAILLGAIVYSLVMYEMRLLVDIHGGAILQAIEILLIGIISIAAYAAIILSISESFRALAKYAISSIRS